MTDTLPHDWVKIHAGVDPGAPAVIDSSALISYRELDRRADDCANRLLARGVGSGHAVPFPAASSVETIVEMIGIGRAGAVMAPYGPHRVDVDGPCDPSTYAIVATSGSSGEPRGVVLTKRNAVAAIDASHERLRNGATDRWLLVLPLFHIGGISIVWRSLAAGGSIELQPRFDASEAAASLRSAAVTMASLVPTMLHRILEADPGPYSGLEAVLLGGGPATEGLVERALAAGLPVLQTYGMTEACSQVATVSPGRALESMGTAGPPLDGIIVTIDNGEILIDGPAVSPGYVGEAARSGSYHTGDLGRLDDAGRLIVTGRVDSMIISGGENVQASIVEAAIDACPGIVQAVVVGVDDEEWGQAVAAVVEMEHGAIADVKDAVKGRLARHEMPKRWVRVERLPLLPNGKPDRVAARTLAGEVMDDEL